MPHRLLPPLSHPSNRHWLLPSDGHRAQQPRASYGPPRQQQAYGPHQTAKVYTGPYINDAGDEENDWPHGCDDLSASISFRRLHGLSDLQDETSSDSDSSCPEENPKHEALLTGKAVKSEIVLNDLSTEDREKFEKSMAKEWASFQKFNAVEVLTEDQISSLPADAEIIGTRWVHTEQEPEAPTYGWCHEEEDGQDR